MSFCGRVLANIKVIWTCICASLSPQTLIGAAPICFIYTIIGLGALFDTNEWNMSLIDKIMLYASCAHWMWLLLFVGRLENIDFTPNVLRVGQLLLTHDEALDAIQPYPWDKLTYGIKQRGAFTSYDDQIFVRGSTTIRLGVYYVPRTSVVFLAMLNPAVVGMMIMRTLLSLCLGVLGVAVSTVFAVHLQKHVDEKNALLRLMRGRAQ